tara:strand:+ start:1102 stop:1902 length:801 start_codon:yes stop_codon:yes gene_type:complete
MENGNNEADGFKSSKPEVDPTTGAVSWDIEYKANYALIFKTFGNLVKDYKTFITYDEVKKDDKFREIFNGLGYVWNQFRSHLRSNYPKQYKTLQSINEEEVKELVRKRLKEMSATGGGAGAGHFTPGEGAQYATPYAFNPKKGAKGAQNIYYYKLGWKPVDVKKLHKQSKTIDHVDLWKKKLKEEQSQYVDSLNIQEPALKQFIGNRVGDFDKIEDKLNVLLPLLKKSKETTMEYYKTSPDFQVKYSTDLAIDYLDDLITLFKEKQ